MVNQLPKVSSVRPNFNYIKDVYDVCLDKYLKNKSSSFSSINYGRKILQSEEEVDAYIAFYGAQHYYKLEEAFKALDISKFQPQKLDILSYGCGAATDTCSLISYCRTRKIDLPFKNLTLIEPSKIALQRGISYIQQSLSNEESKTVKIKLINKYIDYLEDKDIYNNSQNLQLHVFSNILDIEEVNLDKIANLILKNNPKNNYFLCISPKKYNGKIRIDKFYQKISLRVACHTIDINDTNFLRTVYLMKQNSYIDDFSIDRYHRIFQTTR